MRTSTCRVALLVARSVATSGALYTVSKVPFAVAS